jgi:hypothetical protein
MDSINYISYEITQSAGFGGRNAIYAPLSLPQITLGEVLGDRAALPYAK